MLKDWETETETDCDFAILRTGAKERERTE